MKLRTLFVAYGLLTLLSCKPPVFDQHIKCDDGFERNNVRVSGSNQYPGFLYVFWAGPSYDAKNWHQTTKGLFRSGQGCTVDDAK